MKPYRIFTGRCTCGNGSAITKTTATYFWCWHARLSTETSRWCAAFLSPRDRHVLAGARGRGRASTPPLFAVVNRNDGNGEFHPNKMPSINLKQIARDSQ